ncbi:MAG: hypothetical protein ABI443_10200 [Chthoniobacterales bacterium]
MSEKLPVQKLLRLKRYEKPHDSYFERFVDDFRHHQRKELLRKSQSPLNHFLMRMSDSLAGFRVGALAYATILIFAGAISFHFLSVSSSSTSSSAVAITSVAPSTALVPNLSQPVTIPANGTYVPVSASSKFLPTQYVLEPRPVSHEHPFEF